MQREPFAVEKEAEARRVRTRNGLTGHGTILQRNVERSVKRTISVLVKLISHDEKKASLCSVLALDDPADLMDALEQVRHLVWRQVPESRHDAGRHDEHICESRVASDSVKSTAAGMPHIRMPLLGSQSERDSRPGTIGLRLTSANESLELDWKKTWFATLKVEKRSVERAMALLVAVAVEESEGSESAGR